MITPETRAFLEPAVAELRAVGATGVYVFGSVASRGVVTPGSDVDLAVTGVPPAMFFKALARVMGVVKCGVDLVDLDHRTSFVRLLQERKALVRID